MIEIEAHKRNRLAKLFAGYRWNYLPDAVLEGYFGRAYADDEADPRVARLVFPRLGLSIYGGDASHPTAWEELRRLPQYAIVIFASTAWETLIEEIHAGNLVKLTRYAFTSERLDRLHLEKLKDAVPAEFQVRQMDSVLAQQLGQEKSEFAEDHMSNYDSPQDFIERGYGYCILDGERIVCAATTFVTCSQGIEIQINTREEYRRKGLATVAAAHLILHSLEKNLDPNWDAANEISAGLTEKLGYTPQGTYPMYVVKENKP